MGIRIHKCVGFGLIGDVSPFFKSGDDEGRYDPIAEVPDTDGTLELNDILNDPKFIELFKSINGDDRMDLHRFRNYSDHIIDKEFVGGCDGDPEGMIFYLHKDWYRYDNIIDYLENPTDAYEFSYLNSGIYPYYGKMICDIDCPSGACGQTMDMGEYNIEIGQWDDKKPPEAKGKILDSYKYHWRFILPPILILTLFMDDNIVNTELLLKSLKPCKATWWC